MSSQSDNGNYFTFTFKSLSFNDKQMLHNNFAANEVSQESDFITGTPLRAPFLVSICICNVVRMGLQREPVVKKYISESHQAPFWPPW